MPFSTNPVADIQQVNIYQKDRKVLENVNFQIEKGEFVYLIGRTGSGKSSLLKTLYADLPFKEGMLKVANFNLTTITRKQVPFLRRKLGIIFQDFQLLVDRNINDNLIFVMKATGWKDSNKMKKRLSEVLMQVGLGSMGNKMPHQLSGGEQQRVVVARALINEPLILLADEPTGNLDPDVSEEILKLFFQINKSGTSILLATHNHLFLRNHPARVLKCQDGKVLDSQKETFPYSEYQ